MVESTDESESLVSTLLPTIFSHTATRGKLRVLDLGTGVGQSIDILSKHRPCQFFFADVARHVRASFVREGPSLLPVISPKSLKFDVVFFWDYLNLMNDQVFRQFAKEVDGFLGEETLVHGFVTADLRAPMIYRQFKLAANNRIESIDQNRYTARYPKSRQDFERAFPRLRCESLVLFPGNRQEFLSAREDCRLDRLFCADVLFADSNHVPGSSFACRSCVCRSRSRFRIDELILPIHAGRYAALAFDLQRRGDFSNFTTVEQKFARAIGFSHRMGRRGWQRD